MEDIIGQMLEANLFVRWNTLAWIKCPSFQVKRDYLYNNDDSFVEFFPGKIGSPEDVAVDWVSKNIYWTDSLNDKIGVAKMEGEMIRTVIEDELVNPRGVTVHPGLG